MTRRGPQKANSVFAELRIFHTADPQTNMNRAVHAAGFLGEAKEAAQRYRAAVLAHPDLSKMLCELFGYERAEAWTGFVPSRLTADDKYNPSPHRAALIPIVAEALDRVGDYRPYDDERLNPVPESAIREPWKETKESIAAKAAAARLEALMAGDGDEA